MTPVEPETAGQLPRPERWTKRAWISVGVVVPVLALLALLAWASAESGGQPGGLAINNEFGEIPVSREFAPDFHLDLFDGGSVEMSQLRGSIVFLDFWASWCPPCRFEAADLAEVYLEYRDRPVEFVGVDIWDDPTAAEKFLVEFDTPYPNGRDETGAIAIEYGVRGVPEKFFIGPDGAVLKKFVGPISGSDLRQVLDDLLLQEAARLGDGQSGVKEVSTP